MLIYVSFIFNFTDYKVTPRNFNLSSYELWSKKVTDEPELKNFIGK